MPKRKADALAESGLESECDDLKTHTAAVPEWLQTCSTSDMPIVEGGSQGVMATQSMGKDAEVATKARLNYTCSRTYSRRLDANRGRRTIVG